MKRMNNSESCTLLCFFNSKNMSYYRFPNSLSHTMRGAITDLLQYNAQRRCINKGDL
jgi:hypothetical protein